MTDAARIRALFDRVVALPEAERPAFLRESGEEPEIISRVESLLGTDASLGEPEDTPAREHGHPWPGDRIGAYRLIAPIGLGGMGTIWRAESMAAPEVRVAVKFPAWSAMEREEALSRLRQERSILSALDHPGIVPLVDAGETGSGTPFLVLRELHGVPIDQYCRERRPPPAAFAVLFRLVCRAVAAVHSAGVVHRDIKPSNILVTPDGWPTLIDFGIARITDASPLSRSHVTQGAAPMTPAFASPEQEAGKATTAATDVYAIGRVMLDLAEHIEAADPKTRKRVLAVASRAVSKRPRDRYADAGAMAAVLESATRVGRPRTTRIVVVSSVLTTLVLWFALFALINPNGEVDSVPRSVIDGLAEMSPDAVPGEGADLASLAWRMGSPDLMAAAVARLAEEGEYEHARELASPGTADWSDSSPGTLVVLGRTLIELGLPGRAVLALGSVNEELIPEPERLELRVARRDALERTGEPFDADAWDALQAAAFDEEEGWMVDAVLRRRFAWGDPRAIAEFLGDSEVDLDADPDELESDDLLMLLEAHLRLVLWGVSGPLAPEDAERVRETIAARLEDDGTPTVHRSAMLARLARAVAADDRGEPGVAADITAAGLVELDEPAAGPDAQTTLRIAAAHAALRDGEAGDAVALLDQLRNDTSVVFGDESPIVAFVRGLDAASARDLETRELLAVLVAGPRPDGLRRSAAIDRAAPWWWPASR